MEHFLPAWLRWFEVTPLGKGVVAGLFLAAALPAGADSVPLRLLSARSPESVGPAGGNGPSVAPIISADGRFVLFASSANDLVPGDNGQLGLDLFLRDRASNTTVLVSVNVTGNGGGNGSSTQGSLSPDGRFVVFQSEATDLLPDDTNGVADIFVRDMLAQTTELVSVAADGGWANGASSDPVITPDGRYVAFLSLATNLVEGDTNGIRDVFVRDRVNHTTALVSVGAISPGDTASPQITPDGRFVAFFSSARGLSALVPTNSKGEVYVRDVVGQVTRWASSDAPTLALSLLHSNSVASSYPAISSDGRFIAFKTGSATGVGAALVLRSDAFTGLTTLVGTNALVPPAYNDDLYGPEISADGRFVVVAVTNPVCLAVSVWDAQTGTSALASAGPTGDVQTNSLSYAPALTPDGRFVVFVSNATNLVANTVSGGLHYYPHDLMRKTTELLDADTNGIGSMAEISGVPNVSDDGRWAAFASPDGALVSGDNNGMLDVFVRDVAGGTNELISRHDSNVASSSAGGVSKLPPAAVTPDGRWVLFSSYADDLTTDDFNGEQDVFVWDALAGHPELVSVGLDGNAAQGGSSGSPVMSGDARFIAFVSAATNLVANDTNIFLDIFVRDRWAGTNLLVSVSTNGVSPGNGSSREPLMSQDGRCVAFASQANNLAGSAAGMFWRDMRTGNTTLLPGSTASGVGPSISSDGRYVAYSPSGAQLRVWDSQTLAYKQLTAYGSAAVTNLALDPGGKFLAYRAANRLVITDWSTGSNLLNCISGEPLRTSTQWSGDGSSFVFGTASGLLPADTNAVPDVYLFDVATTNLTLVSFGAAGAASANGPSDWPILTANGRFVIFRSRASDLVPGTPPEAPNLILYDRYSGSNALLAVRRPASEWTSWLASPSVSSNGSFIAFQSWSSGFAAEDLNRVGDAFALVLHPLILMNQPVTVGALLHLGFGVTVGTVATYTLLHAAQVDGPWAPVAGAILTTNPPGNLFQFQVPLAEPASFFRIQSP